IMGARASSAKSAALAAVLIIATAPGVAMALPPTPAAPTAAAPTAPAGNAAASTWIGTAEVESKERYGSAADGDLWPTCWADDGHLYSAWGDGKGFDLEGRFYDIGVARISGDADALQGENLALGDDVAKLWHGTGYTRKPTGMVCVGSTLYLAVQDLSTTFDDAPVATIVKSTDGGMTWQSDGDEPMFSDHVFTTIWFADFGRGGEWAPDGYVYAYGLDGNWRDSYRNTVEDPVDVYLARVPEDRVADRSAWAFFAGMKSNGKGPTWSKKIKDRRPVLHDDRRVYQEMFDPALRNDLTVLSQGHVLYNEPLARYIYSSWSEYTHHFYESPTPWGPGAPGRALDRRARSRRPRRSSPVRKAVRSRPMSSPSPQSKPTECESSGHPVATAVTPRCPRSPFTTRCRWSTAASRTASTMGPSGRSRARRGTDSTAVPSLPTAANATPGSVRRRHWASST
ncbi:MAG TPA: DUF4185 domain-containing protein, partial [Actinopolymorphaceae bacterium]